MLEELLGGPAAARRRARRARRRRAVDGQRPPRASSRPPGWSTMHVGRPPPRGAARRPARRRGARGAAAPRGRRSAPDRAARGQRPRRAARGALVLRPPRRPRGRRARRRPGRPRRARRDGTFTVPDGAAGYYREAFGVDLGSLPGRRPLVRACTDWTERRPHVAGALGAALLDSMLGAWLGGAAAGRAGAERHSADVPAPGPGRLRRPIRGRGRRGRSVVRETSGGALPLDGRTRVDLFGLAEHHSRARWRVPARCSRESSRQPLVTKLPLACSLARWRYSRRARVPHLPHRPPFAGSTARTVSCSRDSPRAGPAGSRARARPRVARGCRAGPPTRPARVRHARRDAAAAGRRVDARDANRHGVLAESPRCRRRGRCASTGPGGIVRRETGRTGDEAARQRERDGAAVEAQRRDVERRRAAEHDPPRLRGSIDERANALAQAVGGDERDAPAPDGHARVLVPARELADAGSRRRAPTAGRRRRRRPGRSRRRRPPARSPGR